jgi:hypothetical protein
LAANVSSANNVTSAEVSDGRADGSSDLIHELIIACFGCFVKGVNRPSEVVETVPPQDSLQGACGRAR